MDKNRRTYRRKTREILYWKKRKWANEESVHRNEDKMSEKKNVVGKRNTLGG